MIKDKIIIIAILFLLVSCGGKRVMDQQISHADSLMDINQDSARAALVVLDSLKAKNPKMDEAQQMRFDLVYAKGMNKGFVDFKTDSVMKQVVEYYDKHGSCNERMLAHYLLGCVYRDIDDIPASLDCYLQAVEQVDSVTPDCDYHTLARIYGQIGDLYLIQRMPLKAKDAYLEYEKYSWLAKDTLAASIAIEAQVNALCLLASPQKIIELLDEVYKMYKKNGFPKEAARSLGIAIEPLVLTKQFAKAKRYMDIYERESGYFGEKRISGIRYYTYFYAKGLYFLNLHSDSANVYFQKCSNMAKSVYAKRVAFDGWYKYYKQKNQIDSIEKYADLFIRYSDSVRIQNETETMSQISALYNYSHWKKRAKLQENEKDKAQETNSIMMILVVLLVVAIASSTILYVKKLSGERLLRKKQLLFVNQQIAMKKEELEKGQEELTKMKEELSLSSTLVLNKERTIMMLKEEIEALTDDCSQENCQSQAVFLQKAMVVRFRQLAENGMKPSSRQWHGLESVFESFFKQFRLMLENNNKLNENEYRICMLVWLGFSPNQMKMLMDMSSSNISNIRKRLSKKVFNREMTPSKFDEEIRKFQFEE